MRERINWPIWLWALILALDISILLAIGVAMTDSMLAASAMLLLCLTIFFSQRTRLSIELSDGWLRVGKARIELRYIEKIELLDESAMRRERGIGLDARAFLAIRFWVKSGVKIFLNDKRDPTPYWLISTCKGRELQRAFAKD